MRIEIINNETHILADSNKVLGLKEYLLPYTKEVILGPIITKTGTGIKGATIDDYFELWDYDTLTDKNNPSYNANQVLNAGELIVHAGIIYKTLLTHWVYQETSDNFNTFYQKVITVADLLAGIVPDWIQPTGAHDAYMKGAKVTYNGKVYVSNCDNNVWAPGVYGWDLAN